MPGRKKKCPECNNFIYVRTSPSLGSKILIREDQIVEVEEQWSIANGTHEQFLAEKRDKEVIRSALVSRGNKSPSDLDIKLEQLKVSIPKLASEFNWGLYRNAKLGVGDVLKKQGDSLEALDMYLEVCFVDLNGPSNCGTTDPEVLKMCPPFDPKMAFLAPGVIGYIEGLAKKLKLDIGDLETRFMEVSREDSLDFSPKITPKQAWKKLNKEIELVSKT